MYSENNQFYIYWLIAAHTFSVLNKMKNEMQTGQTLCETEGICIFGKFSTSLRGVWFLRISFFISIGNIGFNYAFIIIF